MLENKDKSNVNKKKEIDLINSYLPIQSMRFESEPDENVDDDCFRPLYPEYVISPGSQLELQHNSIDIKVTKINSQLHYRMENFESKNNKLQGYDTGLPNTRGRLYRLYELDQLELSTNQGEQFGTLLTIPMGGSSA